MLLEEIQSMIQTSENSENLNEKFAELKNEIQSKKMTKDFLLGLFNFDPNKHVRSASIDESKVEEELKTISNNEIYVDVKDPSRLPLKTLLSKNINKLPEHKEAYSTITETQENYNAVCRVLNDDGLLSAVELAIREKDAFKAYLFPLPENSNVIESTNIIPSKDTFYRWSYYNQVNYEEIRRVTSTLYLDKPDLEFAIGAWTSFEGTQSEVDENFNKYCHKHQTEFVSDIKAIEFGKWTLLGDFKQNREKINFYNKNTEVLKRILDRYEDDRKLGTELMKNRVKMEKAKNLAECGPDSEGLSQYRTASGVYLPGVNKAITNEEMLRLEKTNGNIKAAKELEHLECLEEKLITLENILKTREFTSSEQNDYNLLLEQIKGAREMLEVPDDSIKVNVFLNDTESGELKKSSFYTKSDELINTHGSTSL